MNILVIIGSPAAKKGNSESIADNLMDNLKEKGLLSTSKIHLHKEISNEAGLVQRIDQADKIILSLSIYENSVPGLVLEFFEMIYKCRALLSTKKRSVLIITNSGFPEVEANQGALNTCRLFVRDMGFAWIGGFAVAPGTLIKGKRLEEAGRWYKKVISLLKLIADKLYNDEEITEQEFSPLAKSIIFPCIYRLVGNIIQIFVIIKMGKGKYFARPLES